MSEQDQDQDKPKEGKTFTEAEVKEMLEKETSGLKSKVEELLGEKKTVSQKAKELEEAQQKAEEERLAEKQQFKELYEREQKSKQELAEKYEEFQTRIQKQEIGLHANNIAGELTRDTSRAELLAEKAAQFAKYEDGQVTFELGGVPVDKAKVIDHLKEKYPFLADGSGASGGGATGAGKGGGAVTKKLSEMNDSERVELYKENPERFRELVKSEKGS